jgi:hypothetical protein
LTIMAWFDVSGGHLRFRRTSREPVREWLTSSEGADALHCAAREVRFSLIGRARAARRRMTRALSDAVHSSSARTALAAGCAPFLGTWTQLAYAPALPRLALHGRRLVVVPRTMIVGRSLDPAAKRLAGAIGPSVPDDFTAFLARWVLRAMDDAIRRAAPGPKYPLHAQESWACVHIDPDFLWVDPSVSGHAWRGHVMMSELPPGGLRRRDRHELAAAITELTTSLPGLTRLSRDGIVRMAFDQMGSMRF